MISYVNINILHDRPLHLVCPGLLRVVGETSYGMRMWFIGSDEVFITFFIFYLFVSEVQLLGLSI
jgi:hypothetical protein